MSNFSTAKRTVVIALVVAGIALIGSLQTSSAQGWWSDEAALKKLDLSEETVQALKDKRYKTQQETAELRGQLRAAQLKLQEILGQEKPDKGEVDKAIEKISDLQTRIKKARVHHMLFAKEQLTPEQRQKIKQTLKSRIRSRVGQASAGRGYAYEPNRNRIVRQDRERAVPRSDRQQLGRDRMYGPQRERLRDAWDTQSAFADRRPQYQPRYSGRSSTFDRPFRRGPNAPQGPVVEEGPAISPAPVDVE
jgi:Spy/CpxP family protein refolding chaperone